MFKGNTNVALYLVGTVIMFALLLVAGRDFVPFIFSGLNNQNSLQRIKAPEFNLQSNADYYALVETSLGTFTIDLFETNSPQNVNNFVYLADLGYYNNTQFHRVIKDLLIQGGDRNTLNENPNDDGDGYPGYLVNDEINWESLELSQEKQNLLLGQGYSSAPNLVSKKLDRYSVAMANGGPNTNGSQFFIVTASFLDKRIDTLNGKYTVIGTITSGFDIIENINRVEVDAENSTSPRPLINIIIKKVEIIAPQR